MQISMKIAPAQLAEDIQFTHTFERWSESSLGLRPAPSGLLMQWRYIDVPNYSTKVQGRNVGSSTPNIRDVDLDLDWLRGVQRLHGSGQVGLSLVRPSG